MCNYNECTCVYEIAMKGIIISIALFGIMFSAYTQQVEKEYIFDNPIITAKDDYHLINFDNTLLGGIPGEPTLPYHKIDLELKPGQVADSIELIFEDEVIITGKYHLYPSQYPVQYSYEGESVFVKDGDLYKRNRDYPLKPKGRLVTYSMRGIPYALSSFTPVRFNPATGDLSYFKKVTVILYISITNHQPLITNHNKSNSYQILIITSQSFENRFQPLIDLYLSEGLKSQVIKTDYINAVIPGQDLQEKIRNYIIQEYQNNDIEYVVLGGDDEIIPHRGFYTTVQSTTLVVNYNIPADIYYSSLDGNWNNDNDLLWGEPGEEDLLPEVAVGRLVISDTNDLSNALNKIINYQINPVNGDLRDPLLAGEHLYNNPLTWGADYLDLLIGYHSDNGYVTDGIPTNHNIDKLYDREVGTWPKDTLLSRINQGRSFIHHAGHANTNYSMRLNATDVTNANFSAVNGITHNYTPVYSHGCYAGAFDASDCIAEKMLNIENFAVAYVGNSRYGWFNEGQTEGPSTHLHREFADALYSKKINRIGSAHMESKTETAPWVTLPGQYEEGALRHCFYSCNVLGDPVMAVWTDENVLVNATYPDTIPTMSLTLSVFVDTNNAPIKDFSCVIMKNGIFHGVAISDSNGLANITIDPPVIDTGRAHIIISGYNSKPAVFPIYFANTCQYPLVDLGNDTILEPGVSLLLDAGPGFSSYLWSDGSTDQTLSVNITDNYWVEVATSEGCQDRDTISVCSGYIINGTLEYKDTMIVSSPMRGVTIILKDTNENTLGTAITDSTGYYKFSNLHSGTYHLEEMINIPWGGVSTLDALRVVLHFVGLVHLSGLNLEAADVNANGVVNTSDALNIQRRFVGMVSGFNSGDWICEKDIIVVGGNSHCIHNYHALCFGDVDGSYVLVPH